MVIPAKKTSVKRDDLVDVLRLIRSENVGPTTYFNLVSFYGNAKNALEALPNLANKARNNKNIKICSQIEAEQEIEHHKKYKAGLICYLDQDYPEDLLHIPDPPPVLSYIGNSNLLKQQNFAIVGARNASFNGKKFTEKIAQELGQVGWSISSGLARGIDTHAHIGSLSTGTVAVLAGGINHIYPPENQGLYDNIAQKGLILSEAPFDAKPQSAFFPRRNRIISGISKGVLVVEAALKSGSLITARYALEQGREIFAIPGSPFDPRCKGTNELIKNGANLVQSINDINEVMGAKCQLIKPPTLFEEPFTEMIISDQNNEDLHALIKENLNFTPIFLDDIARECQIPIRELLGAVIELELAGFVTRSNGNMISLAAAD